MTCQSSGKTESTPASAALCLAPAPLPQPQPPWRVWRCCPRALSVPGVQREVVAGLRFPRHCACARCNRYGIVDKGPPSLGIPADLTVSFPRVGCRAMLVRVDPPTAFGKSLPFSIGSLHRLRRCYRKLLAIDCMQGHQKGGIASMRSASPLPCGS